MAALFFVGLITVTVAPSVTWIVLGNHYKNDPCTDFADVPNLATYLTVTGMMGICSFVLQCVLLVLICSKSEWSGIHQKIFYTSCISWILLTVSWAILGEHLIASDRICRYENATMYNATFCANVLLYISLIVTGALSTHILLCDEKPAH